MKLFEENLKLKARNQELKNNNEKALNFLSVC